MTTNDPTTQTLAQIQATSAEAVTSRFAEVRRRFDEQAAVHASDPENWRTFVLQWTGRKSGVLSHITDNWLKPAIAGTEARRGPGIKQAQSSRRISTLAQKRTELEAPESKQRHTREKIDLSLPGIEARHRHASPDPPNLRRTSAHFRRNWLQRSRRP